MPFLHRLQPNNHYLHRLLVLFLTFSPIFVILTISYEGLFYFAFSITLLTWVRLEHALYSRPSAEKFINSVVSPTSTSNGSSKSDELPAVLSTSGSRALTVSDFRISLFFLTLIQSAFFSTGNIASISSFSLDSVYRLIPIFDPFSQGALLMLKIMIPFALISANLGILTKRIGLGGSGTEKKGNGKGEEKGEGFGLVGVVVAGAGVMCLHFFWSVRDEGSWLEIGMTISHFVIVSLLCVFVALLEGVSELFIGGVDVGEAVRIEEGKKDI